MGNVRLLKSVPEMKDLYKSCLLDVNLITTG